MQSQSIPQVIAKSTPAIAKFETLVSAPPLFLQSGRVPVYMLGLWTGLPCPLNTRVLGLELMGPVAGTAGSHSGVEGNMTSQK